jgi:3-oxoadipate enol-lactonase
MRATDALFNSLSRALLVQRKGCRVIQLAADMIRVHRSGSGPCLVLLHCLGVDHRFWDFALGLQDQFSLFRYDLPGHGETPVPDVSAYAIGDLSDQLAALLQKERVARAHVAGIPLGGLIAQHFAAHHAHLVDRLVLVDTSPRYTDAMRNMWAARAATARAQGSRR